MASRPGRSAQQAVIDVKTALIYGWYVLDADIQSYFDNIDHEILMKLVERRISDRRVLTKTKVLYTRKEGFDFLGFRIQKMKSRNTGKLLPYMWPSRKAMKRIVEAIREETNRRMLRKPLAEVVQKLNPIVRGWRNYFRIGHSSEKFWKLDRYLRFRLRRMVQAKQKRKKRNIHRSFAIWYGQSNIEKFHSNEYIYSPAEAQRRRGKPI